MATQIRVRANPHVSKLTHTRPSPPKNIKIGEYSRCLRSFRLIFAKICERGSPVRFSTKITTHMVSKGRDRHRHRFFLSRQGLAKLTCFSPRDATSTCGQRPICRSGALHDQRGGLWPRLSPGRSPGDGSWWAGAHVGSGEDPLRPHQLKQQPPRPFLWSLGTA